MFSSLKSVAVADDLDLTLSRALLDERNILNS